MICKNHDTSSRAFSMVEMVIVIVIIGTIAAVVLPKFSSAVDSSHTNQQQSNYKILRQAVFDYTNDHYAGADFQTMWIPTPASIEAPSSISVAEKLLLATSADGSTAIANPGLNTPFGPYLDRLLPNPRHGPNSIGIAVQIDPSQPSCTAGTVLNSTWTAEQCGWMMTFNDDDPPELSPNNTP